MAWRNIAGAQADENGVYPQEQYSPLDAQGRPIYGSVGENPDTWSDLGKATWNQQNKVWGTDGDGNPVLIPGDQGLPAWSAPQGRVQVDPSTLTPGYFYDQAGYTPSMLTYDDKYGYTIPAEVAARQEQLIGQYYSSKTDPWAMLPMALASVFGGAIIGAAAGGVEAGVNAGGLDGALGDSLANQPWLSGAGVAPEVATPAVTGTMYSPEELLGNQAATNQASGSMSSMLGDSASLPASPNGLAESLTQGAPVEGSPVVPGQMPVNGTPTGVTPESILNSGPSAPDVKAPEPPTAQPAAPSPEPNPETNVNPNPVTSAPSGPSGQDPALTPGNMASPPVDTSGVVEQPGLIQTALDFAKANPTATTIGGTLISGLLSGAAAPSLAKTKAQAEANAAAQAQTEIAAANRAGTSYGGVKFGVTPTGVFLRKPGIKPGLLAR